MITIIKTVGLFFLTMAMLCIGYWMGYTERKVDEEHERNNK